MITGSGDGRHVMSFISRKNLKGTQEGFFLWRTRLKERVVFLCAYINEITCRNRLPDANLWLLLLIFLCHYPVCTFSPFNSSSPSLFQEKAKKSVIGPHTIGEPWNIKRNIDIHNLRLFISCVFAIAAIECSEFYMDVHHILGSPSIRHFGHIFGHTKTCVLLYS